MIGLIFGVENNLDLYRKSLIFFMFSLTNLITYDNEEIIISKLSQSGKNINRKSIQNILR